jgi:hypothetical protein
MYIRLENQLNLLLSKLNLIGVQSQYFCIANSMLLQCNIIAFEKPIQSS